MRKFADESEVVADENYISRSILYPKEKVVKGYPPVMPSYQGQLSPDDIDSIIAYLRTLSENGETAATPSDETSADTETKTDTEN
jgi:cytochrome c oxidase subunit 2